MRGIIEPTKGNSRGGVSVHPLIQGVVLLVAAVAVFYAVWRLPYYGDYANFYYRAAQTPLNPYQIEGFYNAPWLAWLLWPLSHLPVHLSGAIWVTISIIVSAWCILRLGGRRLAMALALLSPPFIRFITAGGVDAVPLLGLTLMLTYERSDLKGLGIVLLGAKPQVLVAGALVHWLHLDRHNKWRVLLVPLGVMLLSAISNGNWLSDIQFGSVNQRVDLSPWPYGIPIGIGLLAWSALRNRPKVGALSTFFLVPYVSHSSAFAYVAVLFTIVPTWLQLLVFAVLWALAIYTF
jgi:hypothetical protein